MDNKPISAEMPKMGAEAQLTEGMSVVEPSNNGGRIHRLGYLEIIEDEIKKVEVDTEEMASEDVDDNLHTWDNEEAAGEGRLRILTIEEARRPGFSLYDSCHRIMVDCRLQSLQVNVTNANKGWGGLRPASRPNKKNKRYSHYKY